MGYRDAKISAAILQAIFQNNLDTAKASILQRLLLLFTFFDIVLARYRAGLFSSLRRDTWQVDEEEYHNSFRGDGQTLGAQGDDDNNDGPLKQIGDLGYSGSTFFSTANSKFLVKSLPRQFEYNFFKHEMLDTYVEYMRAHPESLLVRITDFLHAPRLSLGAILGLVPTHHIIMENLLFGRELGHGGDHEQRQQQQQRQRGQQAFDWPAPDEWETYDLKPSSFFVPERDIAGGKLVPESVKERLTDHFPDKIRISAPQRDDLVSVLASDSELLAECNAVDYSLFIVRYPNTPDVGALPVISARSSPWRTGVRDADGKWVYRLVLLDFFWAKHTVRAQVMTGIIGTYNLVSKVGPSTTTADPQEYRERFLKMVKEIVVVPGEERAAA